MKVPRATRHYSGRTGGVVKNLAALRCVDAFEVDKLGADPVVLNRVR